MWQQKQWPLAGLAFFPGLLRTILSIGIPLVIRLFVSLSTLNFSTSLRGVVDVGGSAMSKNLGVSCLRNWDVGLSVSYSESSLRVGRQRVAASWIWTAFSPARL